MHAMLELERLLLNSNISCLVHYPQANASKRRTRTKMVPEVGGWTSCN